MFGVSFSEIFVIAVVALLAVGPQKLPKALGTLGSWVAKLRRISTEVRYQMGVDDILRKEGLQGGISELRGLMRGGLAGVITQPSSPSAPRVSYPTTATDSRDVADDRSREYPVEGADSYGAIADDLLPEDPPAPAEAALLPAQPESAAPKAAVLPAAPEPAAPKAAAPAVTSPTAASPVTSTPVLAPSPVAPPRPRSVPPPPPSSRNKPQA